VRGVYVGAVLSEGDEAYATLNVNAFDGREAFPKEAPPARYGHETGEKWQSRRKEKWTPVRRFEEDDGGPDGAPDGAR